MFIPVVTSERPETHLVVFIGTIGNEWAGEAGIGVGEKLIVEQTATTASAGREQGAIADVTLPFFYGRNGIEQKNIAEKPGGLFADGQGEISVHAGDTGFVVGEKETFVFNFFDTRRLWDNVGGDCREQGRGRKRMVKISLKLSFAEIVRKIFWKIHAICFGR